MNGHEWLVVTSLAVIGAICIIRFVWAKVLAALGRFVDERARERVWKYEREHVRDYPHADIYTIQKIIDEKFARGKKK